MIPCSPRTDNELLGALCPELAPADGHRDADTEREGLLCLTAMHEISLDGRVLEDLPFRFFEDPGPGALGIVAHIATAGLERGEHELRVRRVSAAERVPEGALNGAAGEPAPSPQEEPEQATEAGQAAEPAASETSPDEPVVWVIPFWI